MFAALASLGLYSKSIGEYEEANRMLPNNAGIMKDLERVRNLMKRQELEIDSSEEEF